MNSYQRLTQEERYTIECLARKGYTQRAIAEVLQRSPSSICRELKRNAATLSSYNHRKAQQRADFQPWSGRVTSAVLWPQVEQRLKEDQWSPQQISGHFRKEGIGLISHETIYQYIYRDKRAGGELHKHLRHRIKSYRQRGSGQERRGRIADQVMIDHRPGIVDERSRIGDWEGDTIIGSAGGKVLVTLVERRSRYTVIALADSREAEEVGQRMIQHLYQHRENVATLTFDNGKEFSGHKFIAGMLEAEVFFAHPYHSWERGLNENTNGLIRQYFPKKTCFNGLTEKQVKEVQDKLNNRPRKCLAYQTPNDIFSPPPPIALAA